MRFLRSKGKIKVIFRKRSRRLFSALFDWLLGAGREAAVFIIFHGAARRAARRSTARRGRRNPVDDAFSRWPSSAICSPFRCCSCSGKSCWHGQKPCRRCVNLLLRTREKAAEQKRRGHKIRPSRTVSLRCCSASGNRRVVGCADRNAAKNTQNARAVVYFLRRHHGGHHYADRVSRRARCGKDDINKSKRHSHSSESAFCISAFRSRARRRCDGRCRVRARDECNGRSDRRSADRLQALPQLRLRCPKHRRTVECPPAQAQSVRRRRCRRRSARRPDARSGSLQGHRGRCRSCRLPRCASISPSPTSYSLNCSVWPKC